MGNSSSQPTRASRIMGGKSGIQNFLGQRGLQLFQLPEFAAALLQRLKHSSYWKLLGLAGVLAFAAANLKALPFVHTLRLLPSAGRLLVPRLLAKQPQDGKAKTGSSKSQKRSSDFVAADPALFRHNAGSSRAILLDLDLDLHKSNSTFFTDADVSRAALLTSLLGEGLAARPGTTFTLAGVQSKFLREIGPYEQYVVASQILGWTDRAFYTVTYFVSPRPGDAATVCGVRDPAVVLRDDKLRKMVYAIMLSKYSFKNGRATVAPADVFVDAGLLLMSMPAAGAASDGKDKEKDKAKLLSAKRVEKAVQEGLMYVRECML